MIASASLRFALSGRISNGGNPGKERCLSYIHPPSPLRTASLFHNPMPELGKSPPAICEAPARMGRNATVGCSPTKAFSRTQAPNQFPPR